jgi:hypothetical protein
VAGGKQRHCTLGPLRVRRDGMHFPQTPKGDSYWHCDAFRCDTWGRESPAYPHHSRRRCGHVAGPTRPLHMFPTQSGHTLCGACSAVMESADCWPLAIISSQDIRGKITFGNRPQGRDRSVVSLPFTLYVAVSLHVSGVSVPIRDGPYVEGIQTRQLDAIHCTYRHSGMVLLVSLP